MNSVAYLSTIFPLTSNILEKIEYYLTIYRTNVPHLKDYEKYWKTPFPEGKQDIYMVFGNSDSSYFSEALGITNIKEPLSTDLKFSCYSDLAEYLYKNREIECQYFLYLFADYIAWEGEKSPLDLFTTLVNEGNYSLDPILLVHEHNPLLRWLVDIRRLY